MDDKKLIVEQTVPTKEKDGAEKKKVTRAKKQPKVVTEQKEATIVTEQKNNDAKAPELQAGKK
ncbi:MAG: hypothetical protein LVQ75_02310 [Candidatus Babeliales bacterium]|jgi:hypothetical protein